MMLNRLKLIESGLRRADRHPPVNLPGIGRKDRRGVMAARRMLKSVLPEPVGPTMTSNRLVLIVVIIVALEIAEFAHTSPKIDPSSSSACVFDGSYWSGAAACA